MSESPERVVVHRTSRLLECAPERVWAALTEPKALEEWLCNQASVDLRVGGSFGFRGDLVFGGGGGQRVRALEPGRLLRFDWPLGEDEHDVAEVTWRLELQLDLTRLVVEEALTFEGAGRPRRGWLAGTFPLARTYLPHLLAYLELGFCPVRVDANSDRRALTIEMELPGVSTRDAFAAVSEPQHLNAWLTDAVNIEPRKGGALSFVLPGGSAVAHESVLELDPDRAIAATSWPPPRGRVRYAIDGAGDGAEPGARIAFEHSGFVHSDQLWSVFYHRQGVMLSLARYLLLGVQKAGNDEVVEHIHEIDLVAPPERVWHALTDSEELAAWFCEHADVDLEAGRYDFWGRHTLGAPGRDQAHHPVLAVEPGRRLRYAWAAGRQPGWHYAKDGAVELILSPRGDGTCLRVVRENEPVPTTGGGQPEHFWNATLSHLRAWLELGRPGPRFDYTWPCENGEFEIQAEIDAPLEAAFQELFSRYERAPEPGSSESRTARWGFAPGGGTRIRRVLPGRSFSIDYVFGTGASPKVMEFRFEEEGGRTRIAITQSGFVSGQETRGVATGWFFGQLFDLAWKLETDGRWPPPLEAPAPPGVPPGVARFGIRVLAGNISHAPVLDGALEAADYVGVYEELAIPGQIWRVVEGAGGIALEIPAARYELAPKGEDLFTLGGLAAVEFRRDRDGRVQGMTLDFGGGGLPLRRLADGEPPRPRVRLSEEELGRYAGRYRFRRDGAVLEVGIGGRGLTVEVGGTPPGRALPSSEPHTFSGVRFAGRFEFRVDAQGVATEVAVSGGRGREPFHGRAERIASTQSGTRMVTDPSSTQQRRFR